MSGRSAALNSLSAAETSSDPPGALNGRGLAAARLGGAVFLALAAAAFAAALPMRWARLTHPTAAMQANLGTLGLSNAAYAGYLLGGEIIFTGSFLAVAGIILARRSPDRMALVAAIFLIAFGVGNQTVAPTLESARGISPAVDFFINGLTCLAWITFAWFFYLFPSGRFVPGWTRWLAGAWVLIAIPWNFASGSPLDPLRWPPWLFAPLIGGFWLSWLASQVYRYRRVSNFVERQQTKWVVSAVALIIACGIPFFAIGSFLPGYKLLAEEQTTAQGLAYVLFFWSLARPGLLLLPVAIAYSILRHRLWAIDGLINGTLVYGALTASVVAAYVAIVAGLGALFRIPGSPLTALLATGVIAVLFNPVRERLQRAVNRLMYGQRDDPYAVLSSLSRQLETTLDADSVLPVIAETIAAALKLPYAAVAVRAAQGMQVAADKGSRPERVLSWPLNYHGEQVGELLVAPRSSEAGFTPAEAHLIEDVALQAGIAIHNVRLTADLRQSREQLVTAREEERRRLRRDLHDGLGPKLAGQSLKLEAAMGTLNDEPEKASTLLTEALSESQTLLAEIRRLVYGLRPPALDDLGLVAAIREQASQYQLNGLRVSVEAPDTLPALPAAVEAAAYRILQEALTNVVRHAGAAHCRVTIGVEAAAAGEPSAGRLALSVQDDGRGLGANDRPGVGLASMRERAEEIGGTYRAERVPGGGACITVRLPLALGQPMEGTA